jgi:CBS domain-containing protein
MVSRWLELCIKTSARDLARVSHETLIVLESSTTVRDALQILAKNNILSAPVSENNFFLGFVDVLDITGYAIAVQKTNPFDFSATSSLFFDSPIKAVINFSGWDNPVTVTEKSTVLEVMVALSITAQQPRRPVPHRVAVLENGKFSNVISQSDVITFASKHFNLFGGLANKTLKELNLLHSNIMVRLDSSFSDAVEILYNNRVSGIALVTEEGKLAANFSASDLRGLVPEAFEIFYGSILQFLVKGTTSSKLGAPIKCSENTTLAEAIQLLATNHVHRLYVCTEYDYPKAVVTLTDIIGVLKEKI